MIINGKNPVFEAVKAGIAHKIFVRKGAALYDISFNLPVTIMNKSDFDEKFGREAQGVAAEIDDIKTYSLDEVEQEIEDSRGVVILDRIQDPHNYGAIIRTAHCFGINNIIVPRYHQAPLTAAVCKASAGAIFYTKIIEETNLQKVCVCLKHSGFTVAACDMAAETSLKDYKHTGKIALIIGSEGRGIRDGLIESADILLKVPMQGKIDSLNAASTAAIVMYEIFA